MEKILLQWIINSQTFCKRWVNGAIYPIRQKFPVTYIFLSMDGILLAPYTKIDIYLF